MNVNILPPSIPGFNFRPLAASVVPADMPGFDFEKYETNRAYEGSVDAWWQAENQRLRGLPAAEWELQVHPEYLSPAQAGEMKEFLSKLPADQADEIRQELAPKRDNAPHTKWERDF